MPRAVNGRAIAEARQDHARISVPTASPASARVRLPATNPFTTRMLFSSFARISSASTTGLDGCAGFNRAHLACGSFPYEMPGMDGLQLLREINQRFPALSVMMVFRAGSAPLI
jgi:hypothetical protein